MKTLRQTFLDYKKAQLKFENRLLSTLDSDTPLETHETATPEEDQNPLNLVPQQAPAKSPPYAHQNPNNPNTCLLYTSPSPRD